MAARLWQARCCCSWSLPPRWKRASYCVASALLFSLASLFLMLRLASGVLCRRPRGGYRGTAWAGRAVCEFRDQRGLLPRRRAQAVPGVAHLVIVDLGQIVRRIERKGFDVEPTDGAEQRVGGDHPVALGADQPRLGR